MKNSPCTVVDLLRCSYEIVYRYFISYFVVNEVGIRWALFNSLAAIITIGYVMSYKPWKSRGLNTDRLKQKRHERELHFQKIRDDLATVDETVKQKRSRISGLTFLQLKDELQTGRITASEAVDAFRWKALECQGKFNCITEFVKEAPDLASAMDAEHATNGKQKPPLFGIPFSVKESFYLIGYDCTVGLAKYIGLPAKEENTLVAHLRSLGAIPIVRTNVPQTCISFMCSNPIFGTTLNPYDPKRTPGGSSGGEGCLIATGGCPFGLGNDIGGSLRIPAHFCGIVSVKPTSARPKVFGVNPGMPGVTKLALSHGFFTKDVCALAYLFRMTLVQDYFNRVPECIPHPFDDKIFNAQRKLRIGYYFEDGWFPTTPACKRAVSEAKDILSAAGHELIPFTIPSVERAAALITKSLFPDNGAYFGKSLRHEQVDEYLQLTKTLTSIPTSVRWMLSKLLKPIDAKVSGAMDAYVRDLDDLRATYVDVDEYKKEFVSYWKSMELDAVLGTVLPFPALPHDGPSKLSHGTFGTFLYNLLDFPSGVVPVTKVCKSDEDAMETYPNPESLARRIQHPVDKMVREAMKNSHGLPVGVQIVAFPYREEMCLNIMRIVENAVRLNG